MMPIRIYLSSIATAFLVLLPFVLLFAMRFVRSPRTAVLEKASKPELLRRSSEAAMRLEKSLSDALPGIIIYPHDAAFNASINAYWAKQECQVLPACVIRPQNVEQLSTAVRVLAREYNYRREQQGVKENGEDARHAAGIFAVRSGGHSPVARAASIEDGALIDMSLFCQVTPCKDGKSVIVGTGARWGKVCEELDAKKLAVAGGRNSAVGVGGLILGGGISFFSPRFGFVCSNALGYEIVLADGSIITASETSNQALFCALKGGGNNFGIVTRVTLRTFPSSNIWSGFLYMTTSQTANVLSAFYDSVNRATPDTTAQSYDPHASGPIVCFTYLHQLRIQAVSVNLVYTSSPPNPKNWPKYWDQSPFKSLWRLWSTCKVRTLTSACDEMNALNPPGRRQVFGTTTIKNDKATLDAIHATYSNAVDTIKRANIKAMSWTLVLQPFFPHWAQKGGANPLGLQHGGNQALALVTFTVNWAEQRDDHMAEKITREAVEQIDKLAADKGTGHRYRYINYCGGWQKPFESYGEESFSFLREVSSKYDPQGLFQRACVGGFKLDFPHDEE